MYSFPALVSITGLGTWQRRYLVWETRFKCWKHANVCNLSVCTSVEETGRMSAIGFQLQNAFWKYFSQPNALGWIRFLLEVLQIGGFLLFRVECCLGLIQSTGLQFLYSDWGTKKHRKIPAEILTELFLNTVQICYNLRQFSWCARSQKHYISVQNNEGIRNCEDASLLRHYTVCW